MSDKPVISNKNDAGRGAVNIGDIAGINGNNIVIGNNNKNVITGGGVYVGGNVNTSGGDFVGRDKISFSSNKTSNSVQELFAKIYRAISQQDGLEPSDQEDLLAEVKEIEKMATHKDLLDESTLKRKLRNVKRMSPDINGLILKALSNPDFRLSEMARMLVES